MSGFISVKQALLIINNHNLKLINRRSKLTTLKLEHEIRMSEIKKCNLILREINA